MLNNEGNSTENSIFCVPNSILFFSLFVIAPIHSETFITMYSTSMAFNSKKKKIILRAGTQSSKYGTKKRENSIDRIHKLLKRHLNVSLVLIAFNDFAH